MNYINLHLAVRLLIVGITLTIVLVPMLCLKREVERARE
jgi:hypothetical protein